MALNARRGLRIGLVAVASVLLWLVARDALTAVVGWTARALVSLAGFEAPAVGSDALAIVVGRTADGTAVVRGTALERWHVNLIALPILAAALGPAPWSRRRRLVVVVAGSALVLLADALSAIAFVALQGWSGTDPTTRQTAMRALAVYGSKLVPLVVFGCLVASGGTMRTSFSGRKLAAAVVAVLTVAGPSNAGAAILTVTGTGDAIAVDGFVTLREALTAANTNSASGDAGAGSVGLDTINFNIFGLPGTVHKIQPNSSLPTITEPVVINGYSQLGASPNSLATGSNAFLAIELDGTNAGFVAGLAISAGSSTVRGLVINDFSNEGILIIGGGGNFIRGNFLGTDATGKLDRGNGISGVALLSSSNTVGGTTPADRNLISGNDFAGIAILNSGVVNNVIQGNLVGTDDTAIAPLGNNGVGVRILNVASTTVGGTAAGSANVIAFNRGAGVRLSSDSLTGNLILGNSIHSNDDGNDQTIELGIDLGGNGVTSNDPGFDGDAGPNNLQNFPLLIAASSNSTGSTIRARLHSAASTTYRIEVFSNPSCDPSGNGEGAVFLGSDDVTTGADGAAIFTFTTATSVPRGQVITATATDPSNNTSEFSPCLAVGVAVPMLSPLGFAALALLLALAAWTVQRATTAALRRTVA